jgi:hypothetical protein
MKVLHSNKRYNSSINFVDDANVLVGWDEYQSCCEDVGSYFSYAPFGDDIETDLEPYFFVKDFFEYGDGNYDAGGAICFKLTAEGKQDIYLNLYNSHNGYYGHGFTFKDNDKIIEDGGL